MIRKSKLSGSGQISGSSVGGGGQEEWELRPGGMLVQKRNPESDRDSTPAPTIRVRVKHRSTYHEVNISSQATFGELKKLLAGATGVHHEDQKLMFKQKERNSKAFLDITGVKDKSKIVLIEDPISIEKRYIQMQKISKMEKASKSISEIGLEVDRLVGRVYAMESIISRGGKVVETDVLNLIEMLMNHLLKLDPIIVDGDAKLQRQMLVQRVQKHVETLDLLKIKNSMRNSNVIVNAAHRVKPVEDQHQKPMRHTTSGETVVTTKWETFDSSPALIPLAAKPPTTMATNHPSFNWEIFG